MFVSGGAGDGVGKELDNPDSNFHLVVDLFQSFLHKLSIPTTISSGNPRGRVTREKNNVLYKNKSKLME